MSEKEKYARYLCSPEWWAKRNAVMERAGGFCEKCSQRASHVHHLTYIRKYNENLDDLQALCESCHDGIHKAKVVVSDEAQANPVKPAACRHIYGLERNLLELLIEDSELAKYVTQTIELDWLTAEDAKCVFSVYVQSIREGKSVAADDIETLIEDQDVKEQFASIKGRVKDRGQIATHSSSVRMNSIIERFEDIAAQKELERMLNKMEAGELSEEETIQLFSRVFEAQRKRHAKCS